MLRHVLIFGLIGGALVLALVWSEYHFLVLEHSVEIYGAVVAALFAAFGIWLGQRLTARAKPVVREVVVREIEVREVMVAAEPNVPFVMDEARREALAITPREMEILALVAEGLSNREIAERLFVSENTVKTHCSRAFDKLGAKRRTQAVQMGKEMGLLP
ncbi:transcriptional regulator, LuxR family [Bryocella elongata]|uniref:Transcriptional regulator, LuxR family n=1 Tax=Bryocella elongata TaxID=863522 RepID=A0A1H5W722_9BACT|nr:response regulator transcription factor [Bryocella elongata]SEF95275.1 transcriptional regulator, LuxR family [Bryocella elongata]